MNPGMRVLPVGAEKASERVFHCPSCGSVDVALHGRKMNHVRSKKGFRQPNALAIDLIKND